MDKKIKYGKRNLMKASDFHPKNVKFRVTMLINEDTLNKIRKEAKDEGLPYQTYINSLLTKHVNRKARLDHEDTHGHIYKPKHEPDRRKPVMHAKRRR